MARMPKVIVSRRTRGLARLLTGISTGAASLMLMALPPAAKAQAVNGDFTAQFGIGGVVRDSVTKTDTVTINASEALLDWAASDAGGVFLPNGATLAFSGEQPYTVLNRVTSSASTGALSIAGTVSSNSGGKVWFYNPGGWVIGETGVFNVGSLVLTSLPITVDPASDPGPRLLGAKNEIRFGQAPDSRSSITIAPGARISATQAAGSYVAVVAPKVVQAGSVMVRGSTAYVAAEAATLTINSGLFDIVVESGSEDAVGVSHSGTTTGPAGVTADPNRRIYVVAVPKNQAMTAMISGSLGYTAATTVSERDGSIILSAGQNVSGNQILADSAGTTDASLSVNGLAASNTVIGQASGSVSIDAAAKDSTFARSVDLAARGDVAVTVDNEHLLSVGGTLDLRSANGATAGSVMLAASRGSTIAVTGSVSLDSEAIGAVQTDPGNGDALLADSRGENATSGNVALTISDSNFSANGLSLRSYATSGVGELSNGNAKSGQVAVNVMQAGGKQSGKTVALGNVLLLSGATNGVFGPQAPAVAGSSTSGNVLLSVDGGNYSASVIRAYSEAYSYPAIEAVPVDARTGSVKASFSNGATQFNLGRVEIANYGSASNGGAVTMGDVRFEGSNVLIATPADFGPIDIGSYAFGNLEVPNTVALSLAAGATLVTRGHYVALAAAGSGATDTQRAAATAITLDGARLIAPEVYLTSQSQGSGPGVDAIGGAMALTLDNSAQLQSDLVQLTSYAFGGNGTDGGSGTGGDVAIAIGNSRFSGILQVDTTGFAGRRSVADGLSGTGRGGDISFEQTGGSALFLADSVSLKSLGVGGTPNLGGRYYTSAQAGAGAAASGGNVRVALLGGSLSVGSSDNGNQARLSGPAIAAFSVSSNAEGGNASNVDGGPPAAGGAATGGTAAFVVEGGNAEIASLNVVASGFGGTGAAISPDLDVDGGTGGAGTGGSASFTLTGGTLRTDDLLVEANGNKSEQSRNGVQYYGIGGYGDYYGHSGSTTGSGGVGTGGTALVLVDGGALQTTGASVSSTPSISVNAIGEGGYAYSNQVIGGFSGTGGTGIGGSAQVRFLSGVIDLPDVSVDASGLGGSAGRFGYTDASAASGGSARGGQAAVEIGTDLDELTSNDDTRSFRIVADGFGQGGEEGAIGGSGGNGVGGTARLLFTNGRSSLVDVQLSALGIGGLGGSSENTATGGVGGRGVGGTADVTVSGSGAFADLRDTLFTVSGTGGSGGSGGDGADGMAGAGNGGRGGDGEGGDVYLTAGQGGGLTLSATASLSVISASGTGGRGGDGGNSAVFGNEAVGNGASGGSGRGGSILVSADGADSHIDLGAVSVAAIGTGGNGGGRDFVDTSARLTQSLGGDGGIGRGGTIEFFADNLGSLTASSISANAGGQGGNGAAGFGYDANGNGTSGADGGDAFGGEVRIGAAFDGFADFAAAASIGVVAGALGGAGGDGIAAFADSGGNGGNGGAGGNASGGFVGLGGLTDGRIMLALTVTTSLAANATGGLGGRGGDGASTTALQTRGGNAGSAGTGGGGTGGAIALSSQGAEIVAGTLDVEARGISSISYTFANPGTGPAGSGNSPFVSYSGPSGGSVTFLSADSGSSLGTFVAGQTRADVTAEVAYNSNGNSFSIRDVPGHISVRNESGATADGLRFAGFTGLASIGYGLGGETGISVQAISGPVTIDGDLVLEASSPIVLEMATGADITVGNLASIAAAGGLSVVGTGTGKLSANEIAVTSFAGITVSNSNCPDTACTVVTALSNLRFDASSDIQLVGSSIVEGVGALDVYSFGNITGGAGSGYKSAGDLTVRAAGDATIRNVHGGTVDLEAGAVVDGGTIYYNGILTLGETEGGGEITGASLRFISGGDIAVLGGNSFASLGGIEVRSGNDILVGSDNRFVANSGSAGTAAATFSAGGLGIAYDLEPADIPTLRFLGGTSVDAGLGAIRLSGAAIDARLAKFTAGSFVANVDFGVAFGASRGSDGGKLDADCLEGAICVGEISVSGVVAIGAGEGQPIEVRATGPISGATVRIGALGDVTVGKSGSAVDVAASSLINIFSRQGNIALIDSAGLKAAQVRLSAAAGSLTGNGRVEATGGDVGLTVGGDIDAASLIASRELTSFRGAEGDTEGAFTTPGALRVGLLQQGTAANVTAGKAIAVGTLGLSGTSARLTAGTSLSLGNLVGVEDLAIDAAADASLGNLVLAGALAIKSRAVTAATLRAGKSITVDAADAVRLGSASAATGLSISSADLAFTLLESEGPVSIRAADVTGGSATTSASLSLVSSGQVTLDRAQAGTSLDISAVALAVPLLEAGGAITLQVADSARLGTVVAGGSVNIDPLLLTFDSIKAGGAVDLAAGTITGGTITADGSVTLVATKDALLDHVAAGGDVTLAAAALAVEDVTVAGAGAIAVKATAVSGGNLKTAGGISIQSTGAATLAGVEAGTSIEVAAAELTVPMLKAGGGIALKVADAARLGTVAADGAIGIDAASQSFDSVKAGGAVDLAGRNVTGGPVAAGGNLNLVASQNATLGAVSSGAAATLSAASLDTGTINAAGALTVTTTGAARLGDLSSGGDLRLQAGDALGFGTLDGARVVASGASVRGGNVRSRATSVDLSATGDLAIGQVSSAGAIVLAARDLRFGGLQATTDINARARTIFDGPIRAGQDVTLRSDLDLTLTDVVARNANLFSQGVINVSGLQLSGAVAASAKAVGIKGIGDLTIRNVTATNGDVSAIATGSVRASQVAATGNITIAATGSDVVVSQLSAGYSLQNQTAVSGAGTVTAGVVGRGDIVLDAARDIGIEGTVDAARSIAMSAVNEIRLNGLVTGAVIDVASAQIAIGATGQLGETSRTDAITIVNNGRGITALGDNLPAQAGGYALSQAEFGRIRSRGNLTIQGESPMLVGDLSAVSQSGSAGGQIGETGTLTLRSSGLISLLGSTALANASGNTVAISGDGGVYLDAATASIRLADGGSRAGTLAVTGSGIAMVTRTALADIANLSGTAAITARLGQNNGVGADRTLVEAGTVQLQSDRSVYVQNTAASTAFADRRGIVANTLQVGSRGTGTLDIVINGTVNGATGVDAVGLVGISGTYSDLSSINGCVIRNVGSCTAQPQMQPKTTANVEVRDLIEEVLERDPAETALQVVDSFTRTTLIQLNQIAPAGFEPLIDEPVTGTGNDDLLGEGRQGGE